MSNDPTPHRPRPAASQPSNADATDTGSARRRRRLTGPVKGLISLLVLFALLVLVDRTAELIAARRLADRIQSAQHLSSRPDVAIGGWPFLTQVLGGRYSDVTISSRAPIGRNGVAVSNAHVSLHGVRVSTSEALHGTVADVPVASGQGTALLTYRELDAIIAKFVPALGSQITVVGTAHGRARLRGPFGLSLDVAAKVTRDKLIVTPDAAQLSALPEVVRGPVKAALSKPITLPPFPFNVRLVSAVLEPDGVHLRATARNSVFPVR